ncbi:transglutaminase domain-containing protein [Paenibacillus nasutitermitis]|uniref:Peptidase n=1 Tax=Paenibacillus nasutitermitis TaxID=1652958 RepID=A0A916ZBV1_9BACL|nr:transglutaminase domain-containing protein [Paenibacillus nasutitermitis]GGD87247.1 peptidase [Paenibacillus nasutitermitis]
MIAFGNRRGSAFLSLLGLSLMLFIWRSDMVRAADATAAKPGDFQKKLEAALKNKPASCTIVYTGGTLAMNVLENMLKDIYKNDDYLHYSTREYRIATSTDGKRTTVKYTFTYWETQAQSKQVSSKVDEVLGKIITRGMNDYQKEKAVHDWIEINLAYDTSLKEHSAYAGLFDRKKTVCQGYALLAYKMLSRAGLENRIIEGTAGGRLHTWNLVKLEGKWYHLDTTWDDPVPDVAGKAAYDYFNLTDDQIRSTHTWKKSPSYSEATVPFDTTLMLKEKSDPGNAGFYQNLKKALGLHYLEAAHTAGDAVGLTRLIERAVKIRQPSFTIRYTAKSTLAADLKKAASGFSTLSAYSYQYSSFARSPSKTDVLVTITLTFRK